MPIRMLARSICLVGLLFPAAVLAQGAPPPPKVTVAKPIVKEVVERDDFIGRFEAVDQVDIRARVSGYLDKVLFSDGAIVKAGDPLFTIDQRPYQAALEQAEATVSSAQARTEFAQNDLDRAESLRKSGNIAEQLFDQRRQLPAPPRADLDRAQAALRQAQLDMEFTEIKAPMAGPHLAPARLGRQPRQRQRDAPDQHRLPRSDPFLLRRRRALLPRLFAPAIGLVANRRRARSRRWWP